MGNFPIGSQKITGDGPNCFKRISDSVQHIDIISQSTSSGVILSEIALTDVNINFQVTLTEPHDYTEEGHNNLRRVNDSVQHINTTSYSSSIKESSLAVALIDINVNGQVTVTEPHEYNEEG